MSKKNTTTIQKAESFDMLYPILVSVFNETKDLSKKKQDDALNKAKTDMINKILIKVKALLRDDPSVEFLYLLDEEDIPTNSDTVFILTQYKSAMEQFRSKYQIFDSFNMENIWNIK